MHIFCNAPGPEAYYAIKDSFDSSCVIHPFYVHKMDSGPVRLMTIAHAFNYRVAVLRDGVKSALRVGRSRKAERCFMINADIPWGQQVAVMFQIVFNTDGGCAGICFSNDGITGHATTYTAYGRYLGP